MIINFSNIGSNGGGGGSIDSGAVQSMIDASIVNLVDSGEVATQIESYNYITSADTQDFLTSADTQNYLTSADTQDFLTSADTQNYLTSADTQDFITSAYTGFASSTDINSITSHIEESEEVISRALNDLNSRLLSAVTSTNITSIYKATQSEYNQMVSAGTISNTTAYYIVPDPE